MSEEIKAGIVVKSKFVFSNDKKYAEYIKYISRPDAVRNEGYEKYSAYATSYMDNVKKQNADLNLTSEKVSALFGCEEDHFTASRKKQLTEQFLQAQKNGSCMWQTVISFDNRFLEKQGILKDGFLDEDKIRNVTRISVDKLLDGENMKHSAAWTAAIHYNTDNIHVHVAMVEPTPTRAKKIYTNKKTGKTYPQYQSKLKPSSVAKMKSAVFNHIANEKEHLQEINTIIRDNLVAGKKQTSISKDKRLKHQFKHIHSLLPKDKRMWQYNMEAIRHIRPLIDKLSYTYIQEYHPKEYIALTQKLDRQQNILKEAYGSGKQEMYKDYKKNKLDDMYARMGNAILKELKEYDKQQYFKGDTNNLKKYKQNSDNLNAVFFSLKKSLHKNLHNLKNQREYENLQAEINYNSATIDR